MSKELISLEHLCYNFNESEREDDLDYTYNYVLNIIFNVTRSLDYFEFTDIHRLHQHQRQQQRVIAEIVRRT